MKKKLLGALVIVLAGAATPVLADRGAPAGPDWRPVTHGLTENPSALLPAVISSTHPVRVVSTVLDSNGRPVVAACTATDRNAAARLVRDGQTARNAIGVELDAVATIAGTDAYRDQQWDADTMRVPDAWQRATGSGVTVAVIDTGVDADHPDLAGQVLPGADFVTGTEGPATDPNGHGTHVAGTIAAVAGNGIGIAGVAPDARILPVRVLAANGSGYMSDVANGIVYAADHGADVINMSLSTTTPVDAVTNAIAYARGRGVVVVAAAGNMRGNGSPTGYPAADPGVVAVAATDSADQVAPYSNRGGYVDVAAPGSDILSTYPSAGYRAMSGTSMAAPHVAALAALLRSADRALTPDQVEQAIESSATDLGDPGRDDDYGYGRVDAAAALATVAPPAPAEQLTPPAEIPATTETPVQPVGSSTPAEEPTSEPTPDPTTPGPTPSETPTPSPTASETPTPSPTASETPTPAPAPTEQALARVVRTGPQQLTVVLDGLDGQAVEVQRWSAYGWETLVTYPATRVVRINGLPTGSEYRILVPGTARYAGAVSGAVRL